MMLSCSGREKFEELMPFGSEINKCVLGMSEPCGKCNFYRKEYGKKQA